MVRETVVPVGERMVPAFEIRYERFKKGEDGHPDAWLPDQLLTFAPGVGIVRKDTTVAGKKPGVSAWDFIRFEPGKK